MVEVVDIIGGFAAGFVLADLLTIPYSASALYLSIRGRHYWKIPYAVPIKSLTKERTISISQLTLPLPRLERNPFKLSVSFCIIPARDITLSPSSNPIKFAILTPLLVPWINRCLTFPLQCLISFGIMILFCLYKVKKKASEECKSPSRK